MMQDAFDELQNAHLPLLGSAAFLQRLADALAHLLASQPSELYRLFYRFDMPEKKVMALMLNTNSMQLPMALARMLIDRAREKAESRQKFSGGFSGSEEEKW